MAFELYHHAKALTHSIPPVPVPSLNMPGNLMVRGLSLPSHDGIKDSNVVSINLIAIFIAGSGYPEKCVHSPLVTLETRSAIVLWRWDGLSLRVVWPRFLLGRKTGVWVQPSVGL